MILNPDNGNQIAEDLDVWAKKRRVLFLDLSAEMRQQANLPEVVGKYFLRNDNHFTEEGHAWVADMLAEKISPGSLVRPETSP
jgi:lysophospholipase L1-like esterase